MQEIESDTDAEEDEEEEDEDDESGEVRPPRGDGNWNRNIRGSQLLSRNGPAFRVAAVFRDICAEEARGTPNAPLVVVRRALQSFETRGGINPATPFENEAGGGDEPNNCSFLGCGFFTSDVNAVANKYFFGRSIDPNELTMTLLTCCEDFDANAFCHSEASTPLNFAAEVGAPSVASRLLRLGADANLADRPLVPGWAGNLPLIAARGSVFRVLGVVAGRGGEPKCVQWKPLAQRQPS